jgi:hypothetical protein
MESHIRKIIDTVPDKTHFNDILDKAKKADEVIDGLRKIKNPTPLDAAKLLGDPVQIAALEKFQDGKMSYAEMRGLCG